jgi:hypothetical protein
MRMVRRPLLDVVGLGSARSHEHVKPSPKPAPVKIVYGGATSRTSPADYSRAKSAVVGAVLSAGTAALIPVARAKAASWYLATPAAREKFVGEVLAAAKKTGRTATREEADAFFEKRRTEHIQSLRVRATPIGGVFAAAVGGAAAGLMYASDVNANNLATMRGDAPIGGLVRYAKVTLAASVGAAAAGAAIDRAARAKVGFGSDAKSYGSVRSRPFV